MNPEAVKHHNTERLEDTIKSVTLVCDALAFYMRVYEELQGKHKKLQEEFDAMKKSRDHWYSMSRNTSYDDD